MPDREKLIQFARRVFAGQATAGDQARRLASAMAGGDEELAGALVPMPPTARAPEADLPGALDAGASVVENIDTISAADLDDTTEFGLEAIVLLVGRPALLVQDDTFGPAGEMWDAKLEAFRPRIDEALTRVGRIDLEGHPTFPWVGTGFLVAPNVIMTNRHVAVTFVRESAGSLTFLPDVTASMDRKQEYQRSGEARVAITGAIGIHPEYDLALLRIESDGSLPDPFPVASEPPTATKDYDVVVMGYPAYDSRNDAKEMIRIFDNVFNVKRLQPGSLMGMRNMSSGLPIVRHDSSTLGGNSGSVVFDYQRGQAIALHFGGRYLEGNSAVPLWTLVDDPLLKAANVAFT